MSKRQEIRDKQRRNERTQRIVLIGAVSLLALVIVGIMVWATLPRSVGEVLNASPMARPQVNFNAMGNPNAPVKIVEYADFQCPYCKNFYTDTEEQIIEAYIKTGKVYFEYFSFANFIGEESARAAEAAYCAGDQGKFWEMHDIIYTNQGAERSGALRDDRLRAFAERIELDTNTFSACFNNGKYKSKVTQDGVNAQQAGVASTPSFLVNGTLIKGAQPFSVFQQTIDAALAAAGQ